MPASFGDCPQVCGHVQKKLELLVCSSGQYGKRGEILNPTFSLFDRRVPDSRAQRHCVSRHILQSLRETGKLV